MQQLCNKNVTTHAIKYVLKYVTKWQIQTQTISLAQWLLMLKGQNFIVIVFYLKWPIIVCLVYMCEMILLSYYHVIPEYNKSINV